MIYIISTLFSVFLSAISGSFVKVEYSADGIGVNAHSLVNRRNLFRILFALSLFVLDWIAFCFVYPPSKAFNATWFDAALFALYLPALVALTTSVMLSFGNSTEYCKPLAIYHCLAGLTDVIWLISLASSDGDTDQPLVSVIIGLTIYLFIRFSMPVFLYLIVKNMTRVKPEMMLLLGVIPRGFLFVMIPLSGMPLPT